MYGKYQIINKEDYVFDYGDVIKGFESWVTELFKDNMHHDALARQVLVSFTVPVEDTNRLSLLRAITTRLSSEKSVAVYVLQVQSGVVTVNKNQLIQRLNELVSNKTIRYSFLKNLENFYKDPSLEELIRTNNHKREREEEEDYEPSTRSKFEFNSRVVEKEPRQEKKTQGAIDLNDQHSTSNLVSLQRGIMQEKDVTTAWRSVANVIGALEPESKLMLDKSLVHVSQMLYGMGISLHDLQDSIRKLVKMTNDIDQVGTELRRVLMQYVEYHTD